MSVFRGNKVSVPTARRAASARLFLVMAAISVFAVFTRSEAAAQSTEAAQKTANAPAGNAQHGQAVYTRIGCYECHGRDAQSGRPTLGPNALPFPAFEHQVRSPRLDMPPYTAKVLSDSDLADIYAFVKSVSQPPKVDSVPLLK
jgi:ubiquinol-cytochrome c reductase cytochrome c subunit